MQLQYANGTINFVADCAEFLKWFLLPREFTSGKYQHLLDVIIHNSEKNVPKKNLSLKANYSSFSTFYITLPFAVFPVSLQWLHYTMKYII